MKKFLALALAVLTVLALVSCGGPAETKPDESSKAPESTKAPDDTKAPETEPTPDVPTTSVAVDALNSIWEKVGENDRFPAVGGMIENSVDGAAGQYNKDNADEMDRQLGLPNEFASKVDDVASLFHMMNNNTFTGAAYHFTTAADAEAAVKAIEDNIHDRHWLCGFPDTLVILSLPGNILVSAFGNDEIIQAFKNAALTLDGAKLVSETPAVG